MLMIGSRVSGSLASIADEPVTSWQVCPSNTQTSLCIRKV